MADTMSRSSQYWEAWFATLGVRGVLPTVDKWLLEF